MTTRVDNVIVLSDRHREVRGHITETGEIIRLDAFRERVRDDDEGPSAA